MLLDDFSVKAKEHMLDNFLLPAVKAVGSTRPHILVFGSSAAAELHGTQYDRGLCERVGKMIGSIAISVVAAVDQSLRDTGASSIAIVTPYRADVNRRIRAHMEAGGFRVTTIQGMEVPEDQVSSIGPEEIYSFVLESIGPRVPGDALFLSGTNYQALGALSLLRVAYDVPIVTSNLAALQAVKRDLDTLREREMAQKGVSC
jgi:maleate isomerase